MAIDASRNSIWVAGATSPRYEEFVPGLDVDVTIIGGGIVGVTAAHLLQRAGRRVAHRCEDWVRELLAGIVGARERRLTARRRTLRRR